MTPEEAVEDLVNLDGVVLVTMDKVEQLLKSCVATAKEKAKATETRRCVARVEETMRMWSHHGTFGGVLNSLVHDILRTGGLEVEECA